jgi:hypothetical protein
MYYATDAFASAGTNKYFTTTQTDLAGGNIQVHVGAGSGTATQGTTKDIQTVPTALAQTLEVTATPNPSFSYFTLNIAANNLGGAVKIKVIDVLGRIVESRQNILAGSSLRIGGSYRPGIYIVEFQQGDTVKQLKLVKQ